MAAMEAQETAHREDPSFFIQFVPRLPMPGFRSLLAVGCPGSAARPPTGATKRTRGRPSTPYSFAKMSAAQCFAQPGSLVFPCTRCFANRFPEAAVVDCRDLMTNDPDWENWRRHRYNYTHFDVLWQIVGQAFASD